MGLRDGPPQGSPPYAVVRDGFCAHDKRGRAHVAPLITEPLLPALLPCVRVRKPVPYRYTIEQLPRRPISHPANLWNRHLADDPLSVAPQRHSWSALLYISGLVSAGTRRWLALRRCAKYPRYGSTMMVLSPSCQAATSAGVLSRSARGQMSGTSACPRR